MTDRKLLPWSAGDRLFQALRRFDLGMRRVVVTGLGVVAPNGIGKDAFWDACCNGRSGVGPIRSFDASGHPVQIAAEVCDFDVTPFLPIHQRKSLKIMSRSMRFAVGAAGLAIEDSGLAWDREDPTRIGVVQVEKMLADQGAAHRPVTV